jgi:hypothetical protein
MQKVLRVVVTLFAAFVLTGTIALAQTTPPPSAGTGQTPTSTHSKPRKGGSKKSGHKKGGKKKGAKKTPPQ